MAFTWWVLWPGEAQSETEPAIVYIEVEKPSLSPAQIIWLAKLMNCESHINKDAVNPVDRDGTASLGILQFKQGTFDGAMADYGLIGTIHDGVTQVEIVSNWILEEPGDVDWSWQFPACVEKLGWPPVTIQ